MLNSISFRRRVNRIDLVLGQLLRACVSTSFTCLWHAGQSLEYAHVSKKEYIEKGLCLVLWKEPKTLKNLHSVYLLHMEYWLVSGLYKHNSEQQHSL